MMFNVGGYVGYESDPEGIFIGANSPNESAVLQTGDILNGFIFDKTCQWKVIKVRAPIAKRGTFDWSAKQFEFKLEPIGHERKYPAPGEVLLK